MCGLYAQFAAAGSRLDAARLDRAQRCLQHRGPDGSGRETIAIAGGTLVLGHTRLAILDLSAAGAQPMADASGRYLLSYNGEIYNYRELREELTQRGHRFRSATDTEVLLAAWAEWGAAVLPRLTGMFAFAMLDRASATLTLARDAFGIKPLYYQCDASGLAAASELVALRALSDRPLVPDAQRAYDFLLHGRSDDGARTFLADVQRLPAGHYLVIDLRDPAASAPVRWWWPDITERQDLSFVDAAEQLRALFLESVRLHLRSDVPLGAALSGGIDSSAVVCAMRHLEPAAPLHTFTFAARGTAIDEERWAALVNAQVGATAHTVLIDPGDLLADMDDLLRAQGEPFGSMSIHAQYRVFRAAREAGITVTLEGQGADELLAGYDGYGFARAQSLFETEGAGASKRFLDAWASWPGRDRRAAMLQAVQPLVPRALRDVAFRAIGRELTPAWLDVAALRDAGASAHAPAAPLDEPAVRGRRLAATLRSVQAGPDLPALLRYSDRDAMRWSVESRVPFLTPALSAFVLQLPESYLLSPEGRTKHVFREAMRGLVPDAVLDRRDKIGFATPETAWLRAQRSTVMTWVAGAESVPFLDAAGVRRFVASALEGPGEIPSVVWRLLCYCRWVQLDASAG
jgi:asparagine synthase (glutamine-hydrolysing)